MQTSLFPHETVREQQTELIAAILSTIDRGGHLVAHAPTGLGKTAAALAPAIERAIQKNKIVVFMTSRLTQHKIALETVSKIRQRHNVAIPVIDLIGKKHMCLQPGVENLSGKEFAEYCKGMREDGQCEYYERLKTGEQPSAATRSVIVQLGRTAPNTPEQLKMLCQDEIHRVCPYEISMMLAKDARVIICDYSYIFNERIREAFLKRINRELSDCILIVDEGHNLPDRVKDLSTSKLTTAMLRRAINEMQRAQREDHKHHVQEIMDHLARLAQGLRDERYATRDEFMTAIARSCPIDKLIAALEEIAATVREEQKSSSCGTVAEFLSAWAGDDEGYVRILTRLGDSTPMDEDAQHTLFGQRKQESTRVPLIELRYRCLDPAVITRPVFEQSHSVVIMSGTLTPVDMYAKTLGTKDAQTLCLKSPFPQHNRRNMIVPKTTTKYTSRSPEMYNEIATLCARMCNAVDGNCAIFFPSYQIMLDVKQRFDTRCEKTVFAEDASMTKEEREGLLDRYRAYKVHGAVLLAVMGGSFSEGIDLPGDELRAVIVVGLPLGRPDLETKALIEYYDKKFSRGWDFGYTYPAFNKTLQSAGRCIRTETDRGAIVFLDERYAWQSYFQCFPKEWEMTVTLKQDEQLRAFFAKKDAPEVLIAKRT
jgi:DNA excision repair protein ERCC-2